MNNQSNYKILQAAKFLQNAFSKTDIRPEIFLVLGSGFQGAIKKWQIQLDIQMNSIPGYSTPRVTGHGSKLLLAKVQCRDQVKDVLVATGRCHLYEGHSPFDVGFPMFVANSLGIKNVILTNAAGGVSTRVNMGTLVAISDHINLTGQNIASANSSPTHSIEFLDMSNAYHRSWRENVCEQSRIGTGVYAGMLGPTFETPAEANMLRVLGADLAGMSTVQEVIAARMNRQNVFACSFVTNIAGVNSEHAEVLQMAQKSESQITKTLQNAIQCAPHSS